MKKIFRAKICVPAPLVATSVLTQNKGPGTEAHFWSPPPPPSFAGRPCHPPPAKQFSGRLCWTSRARRLRPRHSWRSSMARHFVRRRACVCPPHHRASPTPLGRAVSLGPSRSGTWGQGVRAGLCTCPTVVHPLAAGGSGWGGEGQRRGSDFNTPSPTGPRGNARFDQLRIRDAEAPRI